MAASLRATSRACLTHEAPITHIDARSSLRVAGMPKPHTVGTRVTPAGRA